MVGREPSEPGASPGGDPSEESRAITTTALGSRTAAPELREFAAAVLGPAVPRE